MRSRECSGGPPHSHHPASQQGGGEEVHNPAGGAWGGWRREGAQRLFLAWEESEMDRRLQDYCLTLFVLGKSFQCLKRT